MWGFSQERHHSVLTPAVLHSDTLKEIAHVLRPPIRFNHRARSRIGRFVVRSDSSIHIHSTNPATTAAKVPTEMHGYWHLCKQPRPDREATGKLLCSAPRCNGAVPRWKLQFQPKPQGDMLPSRRRCQMALGICFADCHGLRTEQTKRVGNTAIS